MSAVRLLGFQNNLAPGSGATVYAIPASSYASGDSSETNMQTTYRSAGVMTNLTAYKSQGDRTGMEARVRINGADGNGYIAFTSTNGEYEDVSGSDSISVGQKVAWSVYGGTGGTTIIALRTLGAVWTAAGGDTVNRLAASTGDSGVTVTVARTCYMHPSFVTPTITASSSAEWKVRLPAGVDHVSIRNLYVRVSANTWNADATLDIVGATGSGTPPTVTIPAGSGAATLEDTTNAVQVHDGDLIVIRLVTAGAGSMTMRQVSFEVQSDDRVWHLTCGTTNGGSLGTNRYAAMTGQVSTSTTEALQAARIGIEGVTLSLLTANVKTAGTGSAVKLRASGDAGTPAQMALDTTSTGWLVDSVNTYTAARTDDLAWSSAYGTVAAAVYVIAVTMQTPETPESHEGDGDPLLLTAALDANGQKAGAGAGGTLSAPATLTESGSKTGSGSGAIALAAALVASGELHGEDWFTHRVAIAGATSSPTAAASLDPPMAR